MSLSHTCRLVSSALHKEVLQSPPWLPDMERCQAGLLGRGHGHVQHGDGRGTEGDHWAWYLLFKYDKWLTMKERPGKNRDKDFAHDRNPMHPLVCSSGFARRSYLAEHLESGQRHLSHRNLRQPPRLRQQHGHPDSLSDPHIWTYEGWVSISLLCK